MQEARGSSVEIQHFSSFSLPWNSPIQQYLSDVNLNIGELKQNKCRKESEIIRNCSPSGIYFGGIENATRGRINLHKFVCCVRERNFANLTHFENFFGTRPYFSHAIPFKIFFDDLTSNFFRRSRVQVGKYINFYSLQRSRRKYIFFGEKTWPQKFK